MSGHYYLEANARDLVKARRDVVTEEEVHLTVVIPAFEDVAPRLRTLNSTIPTRTITTAIVRPIIVTVISVSIVHS